VHGRDTVRAEETCHEVEKIGGRALCLLADLSEVEACRDLIARTKTALGHLDILINNAATNRRKPISEVTQEDFDLLTAVNVRSIYFLSQAAHPLMAAQGGGKIIHISSINTFLRWIRYQFMG